MERKLTLELQLILSGTTVSFSSNHNKQNKQINKPIVIITCKVNCSSPKTHHIIFPRVISKKLLVQNVVAFDHFGTLSICNIHYVIYLSLLYTSTVCLTSTDLGDTMWMPCFPFMKAYVWVQKPLLANKVI